MAHSVTYIPYKETGFFSSLVEDFLSADEKIKPFFQYSPDYAGLKKSINERSFSPVARKTLSNVLSQQYAHLPPTPEIDKNIRALQEQNTYTVCTAHQPNLLTGYLYFIYKILHVIKLSQTLNEQYPDKYFVPIYYMGSEDNDIEELGTFRFRGERFTWDGSGQKGAVGRMNPQSLKPLFRKLFNLFGPPGKYCEDLQEVITNAYLQHNTIAAATQYLVHELFGKYGLIILNPDDALLKKAFIPVMEDELLYNRSHTIVSAQAEKLSFNYKIQANPRLINLFYLTENSRERIEKSTDIWTTVDGHMKWTEQEIIAELYDHPERFSPNVVLRALFQETILPNVAFIGGGAEIAYWMQLKTLFEKYDVFYPCILLRQSVQFIDNLSASLRAQLNLTISDLFKNENDIIKTIINNAGQAWQTITEQEELQRIFLDLKKKAINTDPTLAAAADAVLTKIKYQVEILEKKMLRAEKRKLQVHTNRVIRLKQLLFPNGTLQERVNNFMEYYLEEGPAFFDLILDHINPIAGDFLVIEQKNTSFA